MPKGTAKKLGLPVKTEKAPPTLLVSRKRGRLSKKEQTPISVSEFEVEKILNSRWDKRTGLVEYQVKWKGFAKRDSTWEPKEHLGHCGRLLAEYYATLKS